MQADTDKLTGTIAEAAAVLKIGRNQAYQAAHRGEIPVIWIGRSARVQWQKFLKMVGADS
jgi:excisionase family DNA binding protein